jgi:lipid-A-disaccharide synthase-like uncharacterized protein
VSALEILGWLGNACFFSRWLVQWYASERAKESVAPRSFWWVSLAGTATLGTYTLLKNEPILLVGFAVNVAIYTRNLALASESRVVRGWRGWKLAAGCALVAGTLVAMGFLSSERWKLATPAWMAVGIAGLTIWNSRWALQWWYSERHARSHFPPIFWWVSLIGNALLLAYTLSLGNPVWIASYLPGPIIQTRNLILNRRAARRARTESAVGAPAAGAR